MLTMWDLELLKGDSKARVGAKDIWNKIVK